MLIVIVMGGGAGARIVHGSIAAGAAILAAASATVNIPDKLHLKATPILYYAVPMSMPLPPLSAPLGSCGCGDGASFSVSMPQVLPPKGCAAQLLPTASSVSPPRAFAGPGGDSSSARSPFASSSFSLAQGASGVSSLLASSRRVLSHLSPVYLATSVVPPSSATHSALFPSMTAATPPSLVPFSFSAPGLYSTPVTQKLISARIQGWKQSENSVYSSTLPCYSLDEQYIAQTGSSTYLESLLSTLVSVQFPRPNNFSTQPSESLHTWHVPTNENSKLGNRDGLEDARVKRPVLTVVLLGWLGAQQKHLKKYAEWYNARGIHAVTFLIPMTDILSFKVEKNAEEHVNSLARHLSQWLSDQGEHADIEGDKQLMFHTFSNTGWLTYGIILEKMQEQGHFLEKIAGCVVDSAPVADPDPQVWASGFSAALLKKRSSATQPGFSNREVEEGITVEASSQGTIVNSEAKRANGLEIAVLPLLEAFFSLFLKLPAIDQRLSQVVNVLQKKQPACPQLYIYSTADKVIPVKAVEAFIEEQRKSGRVVRACNLQSSPHVDHFRSHPQVYSEQLSNFLKEVLPSAQVHADAR